MVHVLSKNGKTLMPTENHAKVRVLLEQKKAKIVCRKPFKIQLLYDTSEGVEVTIPRMDSGRKYISLTILRKRDGKHLLTVDLTTRNVDVPKLMAERAIHRRAHRAYRRAKVVRLAIANETVYNRVRFVRELGTTKGIPVKYMGKKPARFLNRKRPDGWLTPTANHLLQTHLNLIAYASKFVPIETFGIEYASFDLQKLQDPTIKGKGYQRGAKYSYKNLRTFIIDRQVGKCLLCDKKDIKHLHHGAVRSRSGSDNHANIAGLCHKCHLKVHRSVKARALLKTKLVGMKKEFDHASILNAIMPKLYATLETTYGKDNVCKEYGFETQIKRKALGLPKEHYNDSYAMALVACDSVKKNETFVPYKLKQYRRHNRQICHGVTERAYKIGKETVAQNRHKRENQVKMPSLQEYRQELIAKFGKTEAEIRVSRLVAVSSNKRDRANPKDMSISMGCVVLIEGRREVVSGTLNKGATIRLVGSGAKNVGVGKCTLLQQNTGLVCL